MDYCLGSSWQRKVGQLKKGNLNRHLIQVLTQVLNVLHAAPWNHFRLGKEHNGGGLSPPPNTLQSRSTSKPYMLVFKRKNTHTLGAHPQNSQWSVCFVPVTSTGDRGDWWLMVSKQGKIPALTLLTVIFALERSLEKNPGLMLQLQHTQYGKQLNKTGNFSGCSFSSHTTAIIRKVVSCGILAAIDLLEMNHIPQ